MGRSGRTNSGAMEELYPDVAEVRSVRKIRDERRSIEDRVDNLELRNGADELNSMISDSKRLMLESLEGAKRSGIFREQRYAGEARRLNAIMFGLQSLRAEHRLHNPKSYRKSSVSDS